jgi:hypothetical protein
VNIKVYAVMDVGDSDILGVYLSKPEAQDSADGLAYWCRCTVQETKLEISFGLLFRLMFDKS